MVVGEIQRERLAAAEPQSYPESEREKKRHVRGEREEHEKHGGGQCRDREDALDTVALRETGQHHSHDERRYCERAEYVADRRGPQSNRMTIDRHVKSEEIPARGDESAHYDYATQLRLREELEDAAALPTGPAAAHVQPRIERNQRQGDEREPREREIACSVAEILDRVTGDD